MAGADIDTKAEIAALDAQEREIDDALRLLRVRRGRLISDAMADALGLLRITDEERAMRDAAGVGGLASVDTSVSIDFDEAAERRTAFAQIMDSVKGAVDTAETAEEAALSREEILHRMRLAVFDRLGRSAEECQRAGSVAVHVDPVAPPPTVAGSHQLLAEEPQAEIKIVASIEDGTIVVDADWPGVKASAFAEHVDEARGLALGLAARAINAVIHEGMLASESQETEGHPDGQSA